MPISGTCQGTLKFSVTLSQRKDKVASRKQYIDLVESLERLNINLYMAYGKEV